MNPTYPCPGLPILYNSIDRLLSLRGTSPFCNFSKNAIRSFFVLSSSLSNSGVLSALKSKILRFSRSCRCINHASSPRSICDLIKRYPYKKYSVPMQKEGLVRIALCACFLMLIKRHDVAGSVEETAIVIGDRSPEIGAAGGGAGSDSVIFSRYANTSLKNSFIAIHDL